MTDYMAVVIASDRLQYALLIIKILPSSTNSLPAAQGAQAYSTNIAKQGGGQRSRSRLIRRMQKVPGFKSKRSTRPQIHDKGKPTKL